MKTEYIWQTLFVLIGALASGYAGFWFGNQPENIATIEYSKPFYEDLKSIIGEDNSLKNHIRR